MTGGQAQFARALANVTEMNRREEAFADEAFLNMSRMHDSLRQRGQTLAADLVEDAIVQLQAACREARK